VFKICYCLSHYYPIASGAERQAYLQATELVRRGHRVQIITRAVSARPEREVVGGATVWRLIRPREWGPLFGATFVGTLCRALHRLRNEYDLVHCHQGLWEAVGTGLVAPGMGKPSVVQPAAGGEYGEMRQWSRTRGRSILRRIMLRNSHFVAISHQIESELARFGVAADRLTRLASGVDTSTFSPGPPDQLEHLPARPRVLFLGRLHPQKNLLRLIDAWPAVRRRVPASLLLAGDGPQRNELHAATERLGIADSVHFIGSVKYPADYLRAADIFVLPSVAEGMSNSLLEAMAVGLPVIVSNIAGNTDLVTDGTTGLLADPHDTSTWSDAVIRLLMQPAEAARLGAAARDLAVSRYSIQAVVDHYLNLYEELLGKRGGGEERVQVSGFRFQGD
jgi:glycosyltransferase involved in cell wall biosynthesis